MTIDEQTKAWAEEYDRQEGKNSFSAAVVRCLFGGVLVKRPGFLLMAEPIFTDGRSILGFAPKAPVLNCWWVYFAATPEGTVFTYDFMAEAPYPLPFIGFKRRGKIKIYKWSNLRKDIYGRRRRSFSTTTT